MTELSRMTWPEAKAALESRTIAFLPIGSTEPHGPHLSLDVDVTIARAQAERSAALCAERGARAVVLPPIAYGLTHFTDGFAGRITLRPGTLWALIEDVIVSLEQHDVRQVVLVNAHLEPAHVEVLRGVILDHAERAPQRAQAIFPDNTRRRFAERLGEEFRSGDCHAGRYESSLVLACDPGGVRETQRRALPPVRIDLLDKLKSGVRTFLEAGATQGYCGDPAGASAEEGRELLEILARETVDQARAAWPDLFP